MRVFNLSPNTSIECDRESDLTQISERVRNIENCLYEQEGSSVIVYAMGAQSYSDLRRINRIEGIKIIWIQSYIPMLLSPLRCIVASYSCLLQINDLSKLSSVFASVVDKSMAGIYVFSKKFKDDFIIQVRTRKSSDRYDFGVKRDPGYLIYLVDADSMESSTGMYEIVSLGHQAPICIKNVLMNFERTQL